MPARPNTNTNSRPAPVPTMDVYTADGARCYSVPKSTISHRGFSTGVTTAIPSNDSHPLSAAKGGSDISAAVTMGPILCAAYSESVAKKSKGSSPNSSPNDGQPAPTAAVGCPLGSRCPNVHIDVPLNSLKAEDVHIHYLWSDESNVTYERLIQPMLRDRPKIGSPKDVANVMLEVYGPNNREPFEMIAAGKVLHTRGARYAFDAAIGTPNRTPSTSRPCHCAHYYFNQVCNRGASCAFIHVVSIDPTQREPCVKAANYHRRIAILAGDHHHPSQQTVAPQPHGHKSPSTAMTVVGGHGPLNNISPNAINYGNGNATHITERIIVRDPREASSNNSTYRANTVGHSTPNLGASGIGGGSYFANSHSPATHPASDQSMINTRNSPAVSRFTCEGGSATGASAAQQQRSSPPTHLMGNNFNNSPAPSVNHQTASPHQSPSSPASTSGSNVTPTLPVAGPTNNSSPPPPPPQQAFLPRSPSATVHVSTIGAAPSGASKPSTPSPVQQSTHTNAAESKPSTGTPPPPPASSLSPQNRPQLINSSFCGVASRQQSEYASHQQSYNAATLPADDFEDGGEFQQQQRFTSKGESTNNMSYTINNNVGYLSPGGNRPFSNAIVTNASPYGSRQTSSAMLPADEVSPLAFNQHPANKAGSGQSPRTSSYLSSGMSPSVVVGEAASKAAVANYGSSPNTQMRTNSNVYVSGMPFNHDDAAPVITVGGQVQRTLLPNNEGFNHQRQNSNQHLVKRTDSYFSEEGTHFSSGPRNDYHHTPPPQHHHQLPQHLNGIALNSNGPCGNSMYSPEGMVGIGMGGLEEKTSKGPMTPQTCGHSLGATANNNNSFCNSPSCAANHITNSNMVTPKSARVPMGRFTHQPYTPPTAMYGTPMTTMHAGTV